MEAAVIVGPPPQVVRRIAPYATLLSGGASGLVSCLLLQPLDLLKTRMQQAPSSQMQQQQSVARLATPRQRTQRLVRVARQVMREDGLRGFWRGTGPTVVRNVPGVALYFYSVSELRRLFSTSAIPYLSQPTSNLRSSGQASTMAKLTTAGNVVTGAVARTAIGFILCPFTVVKARFESSHFSPQAYDSIRAALAHIYARDGVRGLFQGFAPTALRDAPYAGLYMAVYESSKAHLGELQIAGRARGSGSSQVIVASGIVAGTLATLLTHPFDILKTRLQTMPEATRGLRAIGLVSAARDVWRSEGAGAFLDGLGLRCARKAASSAIGWGIFEGGRSAWARRQDRLATL